MSSLRIGKLAHFSVSVTKFSQEKSVLTIIKKRDMIKNLRSTIHHYEHVANPGDDLVRKQTIERSFDGYIDYHFKQGRR